MKAHVAAKNISRLKSHVRQHNADDNHLGPERQTAQSRDVRELVFRRQTHEIHHLRGARRGSKEVFSEMFDDLHLTKVIFKSSIDQHSLIVLQLHHYINNLATQIYMQKGSY